MKDEDYYVAESLKVFDRDLYEELQAYTKKGATVPEVERCLKELCERDRTFPVVLTPSEETSLQYAIDRVVNRFNVGVVEPLELHEAAKHLKKTTSAGYSFYGKKKGEVLDEIISKSTDLLVQIRSGKPIQPAPCLVGTRGHLHRKDNPKRRIIMIVPAEIVLIGMCYTQPIYKKLQENKRGPMMFGDDMLPRLWRVISKQYPAGHYAVRTDISKFDNSVPLALVEVAFDIIGNMITHKTWQGVEQRPSKVKRWSRVLEFLRYYFCHTPIMSPHGEIYFKHGGIPSGDAFTQLIGSIVNALYLEMLAHYNGLSVADLYVLGDDGYIVVAQKPDIDKWAQQLREWFNVELSTEKTQLFEGRMSEKRFLGYQFSRMLLIRDKKELFNLALHPEHEVKDLQKSFSRLIAYMYLGGCNDLDFMRFFEFYQSGWDIQNTEIELNYDLKAKKEYGGMNIEIKNLFDYKREDFVWGLTTFKHDDFY